VLLFWYAACRAWPSGEELIAFALPFLAALFAGIALWIVDGVVFAWRWARKP
jgi:hypothetical protein